MNALVPVSFKEATNNLVPSAPCNLPKGLNVYADGETCVTRWKLSFFQRLSILFFGRIWLGVKSGYSMPPVWLDCGKTVFPLKKKGAPNG